MLVVCTVLCLHLTFLWLNFDNDRLWNRSGLGIVAVQQLVSLIVL